MGPLEIILIIVCAAVVIGVIASRIIRRKQGKPDCDCGECGGNCAHCAAAKAALQNDQNDKND